MAGRHAGLRWSAVTRSRYRVSRYGNNDTCIEDVVLLPHCLGRVPPGCCDQREPGGTKMAMPVLNSRAPGYIPRPCV